MNIVKTLIKQYIAETELDFKHCYSLRKKAILNELNTEMFNLIFSRKKRRHAGKGEGEERTQEVTTTWLMLFQLS